MTLTYQVRVDNPLDPGISQLVNTASATSNEVVTPATATAVVEIRRPQLALTKTSSILRNASPGDRMTYSITLSNEGNFAATNVIVSDPLPAGTSYVADSLTVQAPSQLYPVEASDSFQSGNYSGGVGWWGDWLEYGEADGPTSGFVQVITDPDYVPNGGNKVIALDNDDRGIRRGVDLSDATSAVLSFDYRRIDLEAENFVKVKLSTDWGYTWNTLDEIGGIGGDSITDDTYQTASYDVSSYVGNVLLILFIPGAPWTDGPADRFLLDNVNVSYQVPVATQTGPPPNLASGYYLPAGESISLTFEVQVDDPLDPNISQLVNTASATSNETPTAATASVTTTVGDYNNPGTHFVYLPMLLRPGPTELYVMNDNTGDVIRFVVRDPQTKTEVTSCNVPNNTTQLCGTFPAGTYEVQAFTSCGGADSNPITTKTYPSGRVTTRVFCR
jgi:uncharacterized repeat protein (TIGR01451 family)